MNNGGAGREVAPRYIYLPVEVGSREMAAKSLIAAIAAEQGHTAVIGFQHELLRSAASLPRGVFLSKGSNNSFLRYVPELRAAGHLVAVSEEENYGYRLNPSPLCFNNSILLKDLCDLYLCIGDDEAAHMAERYGADFPALVTGNARTDFLRPRLRAIYAREVREIQKQYGRFILVNTNFGLTNPGSRTAIENFYLLWEEVGFFDGDDRQKNIKIFESFAHTEQYNARLTREVLGLLARRPEITVVIRPHPVEWAQGWIEYLAATGAPNIKLAVGTPHIPFTLAADLVIHPGCATGMEALALGVPGLSLKGSALPPTEMYVSNHVNVTAGTAQDALALIEDHWRGGDSIRAQQARLFSELNRYLADISADVLSAEKIVASLVGLAESRGLQTDSRSLAAAKWQKLEDPNLGYFVQKFAVSQNDLDRAIASLRAVLRRFQSVSVSTLDERIYAVTGNA